jgi:thioredoxin 1
MKFSKIFLFLMAFSICGYTANASEFIPYSKDSFEALQKKDKEIVLQYHASWCPVCKRQRNVLDTLSKDTAFKDVAFIAANYDTDIDVKKQYAVKGQSTIILFQGNKELKRSQGMTDQAKITDLLKSSFKQ